ncbi:MAG: carboxypeptidase-like regulatory domain-containing protein [Planctomycetota bacterium]
MVRLQRGGAVAVLALDANGEALVGRTIEQRLFGLPLWKSHGYVESTGDDPERLLRVTDAEGRARFEDLVPGGHEFRIGKRPDTGAIDRWGGAWQSEAGWTAIAVDANARTELVLTEGPRGAIFGRITEHGQPLARVSVALFPESYPDAQQLVLMAMQKDPRTTYTDAVGRYRIVDIDPGDYVLRVYHTAYESTFGQEITVPAGEARRDVELGTAEVAGRVVDPNGEGVADAIVMLGVSRGGAAAHLHRDQAVSADQLPQSLQIVGSGDVRTDRDGAWECHALEPGVELVALTGGGSSYWQPVCSEPFTLTPAQRLEGIELVVQPAGALVVHFSKGAQAVTDFFGRLTLTRLVNPEQERVSQAISGARSVFSLAPGSWTLRAVDVRRPNKSIEAREVEIVAGETTRVVLILPD